MASGIYNKAKYDWLTKAADMINDTIKAVLLTSSHAFVATNNVFSDISTNEISGTGYTAGGMTLTSKTVTQDNTNNLAYMDCDDIAWTGATFTARHLALVNTTVSNHLIANFDFGSDKSVSSGTFTVQIAATGILKIS